MGLKQNGSFFQEKEHNFDYLLQNNIEIFLWKLNKYNEIMVL